MKKYKKVVFVAENGTCRAPMAAEILKEYTMNMDLQVEARGLVVLFPEPLNQKAEAVMISNGIAIENYMSSQVSAEDIGEDTLVLVMQQSQREKILDTFSEADPEDVQVLTDMVGDELEIVDPYGGTLQTYGLCYETLSKSIRKLVKILNE